MARMTESERKKREAQTADAFEALLALGKWTALIRESRDPRKEEWATIAAHAGTLQRRARLLAGLGRGG